MSMFAGAPLGGPFDPYDRFAGCSDPFGQNLDSSRSSLDEFHAEVDLLASGDISEASQGSVFGCRVASSALHSLSARIEERKAETESRFQVIAAGLAEIDAISLGKRPDISEDKQAAENSVKSAISDPKRDLQFLIGYAASHVRVRSEIAERLIAQADELEAKADANIEELARRREALKADVESITTAHAVKSALETRENVPRNEVIAAQPLIQRGEMMEGLLAREGEYIQELASIVDVRKKAAADLRAEANAWSQLADISQNAQEHLQGAQDQRMEELNSKITKIQALRRGNVARREAKKFRAEREAVAITLQKHFRGKQGRKKAVEARKEAIRETVGGAVEKMLVDQRKRAAAAKNFFENVNDPRPCGKSRPEWRAYLKAIKRVPTPSLQARINQRINGNEINQVKILSRNPHMLVEMTDETIRDLQGQVSRLDNHLTQRNNSPPSGSGERGMIADHERAVKAAEEKKMLLEAELAALSGVVRNQMQDIANELGPAEPTGFFAGLSKLKNWFTNAIKSMRLNKPPKVPGYKDHITDLIAEGDRKTKKKAKALQNIGILTARFTGAIHGYHDELGNPIETKKEVWVPMPLGEVGSPLSPGLTMDKLSQEGRRIPRYKIEVLANDEGRLLPDPGDLLRGVDAKRDRLLEEARARGANQAEIQEITSNARNEWESLGRQTRKALSEIAKLYDQQIKRDAMYEQFKKDYDRLSDKVLDGLSEQEVRDLELAESYLREVDKFKSELIRYGILAGVTRADDVNAFYAGLISM